MKVATRVRLVDSAVAATVIGVLLSVAFASFATAFAWLRADMNARFAENNTRLDRLEGKLDGLVMALARGGHLADPRTSEPDN